MAATVTLSVELNDKGILARLKELDTVASKLQGKKITIDVSGGSVSSAVTQLNGLSTAQARLAQESQKTARAQLNLEKAKVTADARNKASDARVRVQELRNEGAAAREAASGYSALQVALGNIASRAFHAVVRKVAQGFKEALTTMKDVDKELANIQKVTDESDAVIARLGDTAYDTASKYGIAANDFLSASADFAKAGYDNYDAMAELATKTQLVGDVSADVASKFLLSADAAFKFGGDIGQLSTVLDKANVIENNYATSIEKLADGFPIVANTAAMANMSIDETMAAIGTITAVTQESGPMAARALRALILNILKDTTTEVEDGVTVTKDQIKSLQDALKKYAPDVVKAAEATGKIIDPMEAIGALSKAWEEGLLSEQELAAMVTDIGGKLRTNQLLALIKNFDMFNEMLGKSKESAGSADKEIEIMLGTWEAKTNQLKNSWTELVSDLVDTSAIKGGVDMLRGLVEDLDTLVGKATNPFFDSEALNKDMQSTEEKIKEIRGLLGEIGSDGKLDQTRLENLQLELQIQQEILELKQKQYKMEHEEEAQKLQNKLTENYYDAMGRPMLGPVSSADTEALFNLNSGVSNIQYENATQYQEALRGVAEATKDYYDQVKMVQDVLGDGALTDAQKEFISTWEEVNSGASAEGLHVDGLVDGIDGATDAYYRLVDAEGNVVAYTENTAKNIREQIDAIDERNKTQEESASAQEKSSQSAADYFVAYDTAAANAISGAQGLATEEESIASGADSAADAADGIDFSSATSSAQTLLGVIQAIDAAANGISIGFGGFGFATGTANAPGGPTLVNELGPELISENGRAYIANGGKPGIVNLSKGAVVLPANVTKDALRGGKGAVKSIHAAALGSNLVTTNGTAKSLSPTVAYGSVMLNGANIANTGNGINIVITPPKQTSTVSNEKTEGGGKGKGKGKGGGGGGSGGGVGGTPAKSVEDLAKETKDILSNIEKQAKLADNRGQYDKEASLYGQGQKQIDKMVAAYKKAGYKETDDEVLDLLNKRYDYEKKKDAASKKTIEEAAKELKDKLSNLEKQADVAEKKEDYLSQVKFYEQAQEAIKTMVDRYRKAGYKDDSDEILDLLKKNYDYADKQVSIYKDRWNELIDALETDTEQQELANALAEKQQALEDARLSLENAQKQRTIRMYNASTGQWEWVRDEAKVKSAQESLTKAEKDYADEVKDQAIQEIERMRDTMADLNDVVLGPALTSVMAMAESSNEFQNFARALNAVYGVGSYLSSTEGSSKVISTASDSHDTIYSFGNVTLTEEQASTMSVAQLAQKLQVLKIS